MTQRLAPHAPRFLLGTVSHNQHIQNIALALHEAGLLGEYHTSGVDVWKSRSVRQLRQIAGRTYPNIETKFSRRKITTIPEALVSVEWNWEASRLAAGQLGLSAYVQDWLWERSEYALDRKCATKMELPGFGAFLGVEFGSLRTVRRTKELGKLSILAFLSPHHATREHSVDAEYDRFPELLTPVTKELLEKGRSRDARRDEEAESADLIHCASNFTRKSLVAAGIANERIIPVPLGCPPVSDLPGNHVSSNKPVRFLYSGPVSVRKGAHILLEAWKKLRPGAAAELHFFGAVTLPKNCLRELDRGIVFHGPVSSASMAMEYRSASVLVFPTLCDGFGLVVGEAFAHGLPVITTPNAGAADLVNENVNGWLVTPGDADALATRIQWCIDQAGMLQDFREPARETARQWSWAHFRRSFLEQLTRKLMPIMESADA